MGSLRAFLFLTGAAALAGTTLGFADPIAELGQKEYLAKCAICHGPEGKGDGPFVNQLKAGSSDLTVLTAGNQGKFPSARVLEILDGRSEMQEHGPREMPIWGEVYLSEASPDKTLREREPYVSARLHALVAYLETLQVADSAKTPGSDSSVDLGKKEYAAKCAVCHGPAGKGDGPFVSQLKTGSSDLTVLAANNDGEFPASRVFEVLDGRSEIQEHGPREMPIWGEVYLSEESPDKTLREREPYVSDRLHALVAYLETLQAN